MITLPYFSILSKALSTAINPNIGYGFNFLQMCLRTLRLFTRFVSWQTSYSITLSPSMEPACKLRNLEMNGGE
jgi:hypothetical protein